jgi:hypothetical protein
LAAELGAAEADRDHPMRLAAVDEAP